MSSKKIASTPQLIQFAERADRFGYNRRVDTPKLRTLLEPDGKHVIVFHTLHGDSGLVRCLFFAKFTNDPEPHTVELDVAVDLFNKLKETSRWRTRTRTRTRRPLPEQEYTSFTETLDAIMDAARVAVSENPDTGEEDAAHDIAISLFSVMSPSVRHEIARGFLGWSPVDDRDLYVNNNVPLREGR